MKKFWYSENLITTTPNNNNKKRNGLGNWGPVLGSNKGIQLRSLGEGSCYSTAYTTHHQ